MKALKHILTAVIIVLFGVLITVLVVPLIKRAQPVEVTILAEPSISSMPIYYAQEKGIFSSGEVKVEATIKSYTDPSQALGALATGEAQFAVIPWPEAIKWMSEKGRILKAFFSVEFKAGVPQEGLFTREGLRFEKIGDVEGKTVGVSPLTQTPLRAALVSAQVDAEDFTIKAYPDQQKLFKAFQAGELDLAVFLEPYFTVAEMAVGEPFAEGSLFPKWISSPYPGSGLFVSPAYFEENKQAVVRMRKAMDLAFLEMAKRPDTARAVTGRNLGITDSQVVKNLNLPTYQRTHEVDKIAVQELTDRLQGYGVIPNPVDIEEAGIIIPNSDLKD